MDILHIKLPPLAHQLNLPLKPRSQPLARTASWFGASSSLRPTPLLDGGFPEVRSLESLKTIHAQVVKLSEKHTFDQDLLKCYLDFGDVESAAVILLLGGFMGSQLGRESLLGELRRDAALSLQVLQVFRDMHSKGITVRRESLVFVLMICTDVMDSLLGAEVHACVMKFGLMVDTALQRALLNFFERCWGIETVNKLCYDLPEMSDIVWNEVVKLNLKNERWERAFELFRDMQSSHVIANATTVAKLVQACGKLKANREGKQIHAHVLRRLLRADVSVWNALISMYTKTEELEMAQKVFSSMEDRNLTSWNCMVSAHALLGNFDDAWDHLVRMESYNIRPDIITWNSLLSGFLVNGSYDAVLSFLRRMQSEGLRLNSCSVTLALQSVIKLGLLNHGKEIHGYVVRQGLDYDVYVGTSLVDMYVKSDRLPEARSVFSCIRRKNIFTWNCLLSGYSMKGLFVDAESLLEQLKDAGIRPDLVTYNSLLSGYSTWGHTNKAMSTMQKIERSGLIPNVVSWTALISGCSQQGIHNEALEFFVKMQQQGIKPNAATISCLLRSCGGLSLLQKGKEIHCFSIKSGMINDPFVATATVDMYNKSGDLRCAIKVFRRIDMKPLAAWNCMIMGFATYSRGKEAILLFHEMCALGISPDSITFTNLLSGCKNSGLISEGWSFFDGLSGDFKVTPKLEHYCCMVDLLGRAGYLDEAWHFIQKMPLTPDATIWGSLLCSSRIHRNVEYAEIAAKHLFKLEPQNSANYILMVNLYAVSNRWKDVETVKDLMNRKGMRSGQSWSWISIDNTVHHFSAEEDGHPETGAIYYELYQLVSEIRKLGYVPNTECVYQKVEDEAEKERLLLSHTEKMALTYGLMKSASNAPIRVVKNSRICSDCHNAAKYISIARSREIFIKDGARFHHFREGNCTCHDCW